MATYEAHDVTIKMNEFIMEISKDMMKIDLKINGAHNASSRRICANFHFKWFVKSQLSTLCMNLDSRSKHSCRVSYFFAIFQHFSFHFRAHSITA